MRCGFFFFQFSYSNWSTVVCHLFRSWDNSCPFKFTWCLTLESKIKKIWRDGIGCTWEVKLKNYLRLGSNLGCCFFLLRIDFDISVDTNICTRVSSLLTNYFQSRAMTIRDMMDGKWSLWNVSRPQKGWRESRGQGRRIHLHARSEVNSRAKK